MLGLLKIVLKEMPDKQSTVKLKSLQVCIISWKWEEGMQEWLICGWWNFKKSMHWKARVESRSKDRKAKNRCVASICGWSWIIFWMIGVYFRTRMYTAADKQYYQTIKKSCQIWVYLGWKKNLSFKKVASVGVSSTFWHISKLFSC